MTTFLWRIFSFFFSGWQNLFMHIALAWRYGFYLSKIISGLLWWIRRKFQYIWSFQLLFHKSRFWCFIRSLAWDPFTTTSVPKLIFLFPISTDGRRGLFLLFGILANHLASIFFLPLSGDSLGLLYVPVPHSLPIRSQSTNICWFPFWPGFVTWTLT